MSWQAIVEASGRAAGLAERAGEPWEPPKYSTHDSSPTRRRLAAYWWHAFTVARHSAN
jgi:hypothetical protein